MAKSEHSLGDLIVFLSEVPFFSEVSEESLRNLCQRLKRKSYGTYDRIFEKGETGEAMYTILEGSVKVHEGDHVFDTLARGQSFGEYSLIDNQARSASVTALDDTVLLEIERAQFLELIREDAGFAEGLLAVLIKRHRDLDRIQERLANSKQELETANHRMHSLIEGAMDAIIMFDHRFRVILTNPSARQLLQNEDPVQRNVLFFFDEQSATLLESLVEQAATKSGTSEQIYLPTALKLIGSEGLESYNEGTLSKYGSPEQPFFTLILRNLEERLKAEEKIGMLTEQAEYLETELKELSQYEGMVAEDPKMQAVLEQIRQVAATNATVLVTGETGTGKELVARAIHASSPRKEKAFIRVNCGAIPANLIESELFGHEKGAFTGATSARKGRFLLADGGSIFLDEIGELPLELQPKLLRVLQEGEIDPVGSSETLQVDIRVIAATHRNLSDLIRKGTFREDLYYRLNVFPIALPALRERGEDLLLITREMLRRFAVGMNRKVPKLSQADQNILLGYAWPGNVRELQNTIERALILYPKGPIDWRALIPASHNDNVQGAEARPEKILDYKELTALEIANIRKALKKTGWRISGPNGAAALLNIPPTTLASKIKALGIQRPV